MDKARKRYNDNRIKHWDKISFEKDRWFGFGKYYSYRLSQIYKLLSPRHVPKKIIQPISKYFFSFNLINSSLFKSNNSFSLFYIKSPNWLPHPLIHFYKPFYTV